MPLRNNRTEHFLNAISVTLLPMYFVLSKTGMISATTYLLSEWILGACAILILAAGLLCVGITRFAGVVMFFGGFMGFPFSILSIIAGLRLLRSSPIVAQTERENCCTRCGYSLKELTVPRCPECGCLRGFDVPMEELGLTEEDLNSGARGS